ncbi:type VI secretion system baseplate subunit TssK [Maridesulfovibrio hydrothermalis]|uniref:Type VI secretion protein, VC_A0114 family n=1 Tax=Maridesulfovibrio hydrothermalis AM13 = DSM 14728 TaxID=1121451 RepID=L0RD65_9BACT|nr:type VI secretion system baseplate subunit TssK [Maridesulfovibrio hydrothermalis]CCO24167.1 Type VI secretion protein, VC_A0114 family [Maridesulfovibrio hydrothermalis AM13 = DSM 14728]
MHANKPLFWHQGLFLQPQHFQLADLHQLHRLRAIREFGQPYFWGVTRLKIRTGALERRNFEVSDIEILFDDGNFVCFPGNAKLEPRSFDKAWVDGEKPFMVYLGLRKWNPEGGNVSLVDDDASVVNTMFAASPDPEELPDMLGNGPVAQVKPMRYVLRLFFENELEDLGAYTILPLARLILDVQQVRLDDSFIPPALTMRASDSLNNIFKDISDQVASRCRRLEQYKNPAGLGAGDLDFTSTVFLLALRTLNRYAPKLKHLADAPNIHPWKAFGVLRQIIGELSSFSRDISALGEGGSGEKLVPDYDHENLGPCFEAARSIITHILDSLTAGPEFMSQFVFEDPYYTAELPERAFGPGNTFWLLVRTDRPDQALPEILKIAKLSATRGMSALLARAVHGIGLIHVENPPPGLPRSKGALCFRFDTLSHLWEDVEKSRSISLYWDSAPKEMTAYIAAMRG